MKRPYPVTLAIMLSFCVICIPALADYTVAPENITLYDGQSSNGIHDGKHWWNGSENAGENMGNEDYEVEPRDYTGQEWDLEAFLLDTTDSRLQMVGGYDFQNGFQGETSGDIFVAIGKEPVYGEDDAQTPSGTETNRYGYDYVIDIDWATLSYQVFSIDSSAVIERVSFKLNRPGSNPLQYVSGGTLVYEPGIQPPHFDVYSGLTDAEVSNPGVWDITGGNHYAVELALGEIDLGKHSLWDYVQHKGAWFHFTQSCGNDNLIGYHEGDGQHLVPEPATMSLLGMGIAGLLVSRLRRRS